MSLLVRKIFIVLLLSLLISSCSDSGSTITQSLSSFTLKGGGTASFMPSILAADPSYLNIKVYEFWASESGDCSSPTLIYSESNPSYTNMLISPTIGSGALASGTYNCVIMVMSDNINYSPAANDGTSCVAGVDYTRDVCGASPGGTFVMPSGSSYSSGSCDDTEQQIPIYISTWSSETGGGSANPFEAPTADPDATKGFNLGSALTVAGDYVGTFIVDATGKIDGSDPSDCDMQPPVWAFE